VRISHAMVGNDEHSASTAGRSGLRIVRKNDEMFCYFPDAKRCGSTGA
jgi:hypothetical protein